MSKQVTHVDLEPATDDAVKLGAADKRFSEVNAVAYKSGAAAGVSATFDVVTALQFNGTTLQFKNRKSVTVTGGIVTAVGAESEWADVPTA